MTCVRARKLKTKKELWIHTNIRRSKNSLIDSFTCDLANGYPQSRTPVGYMWIYVMDWGIHGHP